ncbi:MAG: hypothetical protein HW380_1029 [Magnetococcales bacterium]|nr:hypothetical protein [Magnetococcales bacterium]
MIPPDLRNIFEEKEGELNGYPLSSSVSSIVAIFTVFWW